MKDYVVSPETGQRLKEAGFRQDTILYRDLLLGDVPRLRQPGMAHEVLSHRIVAAPMLGEILDALPVLINDSVVRVERALDGGFVAVADDYDWYHESNPAEAAALLWLRLKEEGLLGASTDTDMVEEDVFWRCEVCGYALKGPGNLCTVCAHEQTPTEAHDNEKEDVS